MESVAAQDTPTLTAIDALLAQREAADFTSVVRSAREKLEAKRKAVVASVQERLTTGLVSLDNAEMQAILSECAHAKSDTAFAQDYTRLVERHKQLYAKTSTACL